MRLSRRVLAAIALAIATASDASSQAVSRRTTSAPEVLEAFRAYEAALRSLQPDRLLAFYAHEPDFRGYLDGRILTYDEIAAMMRQALPNLQRIDGGIPDPIVTVITPEVVVTSGNLRETTTDKVGQVNDVSGTVSFVWVKRSTVWKVLYWHVHHAGASIPK
jgi:hypothetical protein